MRRNEDKTKERSSEELQKSLQGNTDLDTFEVRLQQAEQAPLESKEGYQFLVDHSKEIILVLNKKGKIIFANKNTLKDFGYSKEEIIGKSITHFLTAGSITKALYALAQEFLGRPQPELEVQAKTKSGKIRYLSVAEGSAPIHKNGKLIGMMISANDITERKRAEEELRKSEERFKLIFEHAPDAYYLNDLKGNFIAGNKATEKITGYEKEELIGGSFLKLDLLSLDQLPKAATLLAKNAMGKPTGPDEFILKRKSGDKVAAEISTHPIKIENLTVVLGIARDITERKNAEKTLKESEEKYRTLTEHINIGVYRNTVGPHGRFLEANPAIIEMFGYKSKKEFMAENVADLYQNAEDRKEFNGKMIRNGFVRNAELLLKKKEGKPFIGSISAVTVKDEKGNIKYYDGTIEDISGRKQTENELRQASYKIRQALGSIVNVVTATVEIKDPYTAGHQRRVADLARAIATEISLSKDQIEGIRIAGTIHDLGKLFIPGEILSKPGILNEYEFSLIRLHSQVGFDILKDIEFPWPIAQIVYQHHERMDGSGYPQGLKGGQILIEARILGVADVVEAMSSHRPYRPALGIAAALEEIEKNRSILYDSDVVSACLTLFREKGFNFG